jgi:hypothetical protein
MRKLALGYRANYRTNPLDASEVGSDLVGKTIASVKTFEYMDWPCIEKVVFTDGYTLELNGAADCAIIAEYRIGRKQRATKGTEEA